MHRAVIQTLQEHGIQPSAQRVAIAEHVLQTAAHPSAEQVLASVQETFPLVSRATVYNTLNLFVRKGLLREYVLTEGRVVFDPKMERHHHFIDEATGEIHDLPWDAVEVVQRDPLEGFAVHDYQVVMRGRKRGGRRR